MVKHLKHIKQLQREMPAPEKPIDMKVIAKFIKDTLTRQSTRTRKLILDAQEMHMIELFTGKGHIQEIINKTKEDIKMRRDKKLLQAIKDLEGK